MPTIPTNCDFYGEQEYGRVLSPIAYYGTLAWWSSTTDAPPETMVDERISQSEPNNHDGDGTYLSTLNISSSSPVEKHLSFYVEPWQSYIGTYQDEVYYPYAQNSISVRINIAATELNDKGYYHQFRNPTLHKPDGTLIGYSSGSGELSLDYNTFSFPLTDAYTDALLNYFLEDHYPSGAIMRIEYYHTHNRNADNARVTAMSLEVRGSFQVAYCWDGSGGIRPGPSGDDTFGNSFFKMLMIGDK